MSTAKGKRRQASQQAKAEKRKKHGKPGSGKSRYGLKHAEQKKGYFSDTSPFRFGPDIEE